jgi:putative membrane protein
VRRPLAAGLVTGLLVAGFDAVMEPVAIRLGYWTWASVGVPLQNHAAWFVIGGGLAAAYAALRPRTRAWAPLVAVAAQLVFFAGLRFLPA